jgi:hypothetical protein
MFPFPFPPGLFGGLRDEFDKEALVETQNRVRRKWERLMGTRGTFLVTTTREGKCWFAQTGCRAVTG